LEYRGEPPGIRRAHDAATRAVSGRDERQPAHRVVPDDRAFDENGQAGKQIALFPEDRAECEVVHVRLSGLRLRRPRQWGGCWLACHLWDQLQLDEFWSPRLPVSRQGTRWLNVLKTLVTYRLIDPGSEWRLHRQWYEQSAMGDLLGEVFDLVQKDNLYRCLDKLLAHKTELFSFLQQR
jgi:hypothetical protein